MSSTSSIETPTTPTALPQQQQQQQPQQQQQHQHLRTTTAIVASQQKRQPVNAKRSYSVSSSASSSASFVATAGPLPSPSANEKTAQAPALFPSIIPPTFSNCADSIASVHHPHQNQSQSQNQNQNHNQHQHQQQNQQQRQSHSHSHSMVQRQPSLRYEVRENQQVENLSSTMASSEPFSSLGDDASASFLNPSDIASHYCTTSKATKTSLTTQKMHRTIPSDKINLRLILVSGKTKEFLFNPSDSAGDIAQTVFDNWPEDWAREAVSKAEILRLIYQGRFLHCNVTLGALGLPLGKTTVMHLVPRDNLPEPNSQDQRQKSKGGSGRCCSTSCCIL